MDDRLAEEVLRTVERIPAGSVVSYGDIAGLVGTGPRQVGAVMATDGSAVPWWRVVRADGTMAPGLVARARPHWRDEGIEVSPSGAGCRIARHRADLVALAAEHDAVVAELRHLDGVPPAVGGPDPS